MKRGVLALVLCFCLCGCGLLPEKAWESVRADFDGDGVEERFELRLDGEELQLWFAGAGEEQRLAYRLLHGKRGGASDAERGAYPERCGTFGSLPHDVGINRLRYDDERQSGKSR